jgi:hypothetical protein
VTYPVALALTLTIEVPLYLILGRVLGRRVDARGIGAAFAVNIGSHPLLWFAMFPAASWALGDTGGLLLEPRPAAAS